MFIQSNCQSIVGCNTDKSKEVGRMMDLLRIEFIKMEDLGGPERCLRNFGHFL